MNKPLSSLIYAASRRFVVLCAFSAAVSGGTAHLLAYEGETDDPVLSSEPHSPFTGPEVVVPGDCFSRTQCTARPFDTSRNLAYQGNGYAKPAVALNTISGWPDIHRVEFGNDGFYGNGRSWIAGEEGAPSWIKIDLGRSVLINDVRFGQDRLGYWTDRSPQTFSIEIALTDNVYANGDESNDQNEYREIANSDLLGYTSPLARGETLSISFQPIVARFVKITVSNDNTRFDEIEIFGPADANLGAAYVDIDSLPDINGNLSPEIAALVKLPDGQPQVIIKDSDTKAFIAEMDFGNPNQTAKGVTGLLDITGNGSPEVAVLLTRQDGVSVVQMRDGQTGRWIDKMRFFGPEWETKAITSQDLDLDGVSEISVLAVSQDGTKAATQIRDSVTKETLNWIGWPVE